MNNRHNPADPDYLDRLADIADPDQLWRHSPFVQAEMPDEKQHQLYTGIALRRHAADIRELRAAADSGRSVVYTKIPGGRRHSTIAIPRRLREEL